MIDVALWRRYCFSEPVYCAQAWVDAIRTVRAGRQPGASRLAHAGIASLPATPLYPSPAMPWRSGPWFLGQRFHHAVLRCAR